MINFSEAWAVLFKGTDIDIKGVVNNLDAVGYDVITVGSDALPVLTFDDRNKLFNVDTPTLLVVDLDRTDSYDVKEVLTLAASCRPTNLRLVLFSSRDLTELGREYNNIYANCALVVEKQWG